MQKLHSHGENTGFIEKISFSEIIRRPRKACMVAHSCIPVSRRLKQKGCEFKPACVTKQGKSAYLECVNPHHWDKNKTQ